MKMAKQFILSILIFLSVTTVSAQNDTRYDTDLNLPFNAKAGDVNQQTGSITIGATDVNLPGRAGMNFILDEVGT
jgi:hypothetical protein